MADLGAVLGPEAWWQLVTCSPSGSQCWVHSSAQVTCAVVSLRPPHCLLVSSATLSMCLATRLSVSLALGTGAF